MAKPAFDCRSKTKDLPGKKHLSLSSGAVLGEKLRHPLRRATVLCLCWERALTATRTFPRNNSLPTAKGNKCIRFTQQPPHDLKTKARTSAPRVNNALNNSRRKKRRQRLAVCGIFSLKSGADRRAIPSNERDHSPTVIEAGR